MPIIQVVKKKSRMDSEGPLMCGYPIHWALWIWILLELIKGTVDRLGRLILVCLEASAPVIMCIGGKEN